MTFSGFASSPAQQAIATLIDLAQNGEIDPWDVQVIAVLDRFLQELGLTEGGAISEADLPQSGQTFLWASKLVALKAETLEQLTAPPAPEPEEDWETAILEEGGRSLPLQLEKHLRRRPVAPPRLNRRVTLEELIAQIQQIANEIEDNRPQPRPRRPRVSSKREALKRIAALAHDENLTALAQELEAGLAQFWPQRGNTNLETLVRWWTDHHHGTDHPVGNHDRVGLFWALLLLASQGKVDLYQETFYGDLLIAPVVVVKNNGVQTP